MPPSCGLPPRVRDALLRALLLVSALGISATGASASRLMSWNLLNYPSASGDSREDDFRAVIGAVGPDLLAVQEIRDASGADEFLRDVLELLEPGEWSLASFSLSEDTERAVYYRTAAFSEVDHGQLLTEPRRSEWWRLRPAGYVSGGADFWIYVVHLKASQGSDEENRRFAAAQIIRDHMETLPPGANIVLCGDFNIYDSGEAAWVELTGPQANDDGRTFDPIGRVGDWHNTASFADIHTQSTRTTFLGDGGATGGMDDRFDFILGNDDTLDGEAFDLREATYVAYGQDGLHFNANVNDPPTNAAVGQAMADHLQAASDHLPLYVDLQTPAEVQLAGDLDFGAVLVGSAADAVVAVANPAPPGADELDAAAAIGVGFDVAPPTVVVDAQGSQQLTVSVDTTTPAELANSLVVSSDAVDDPVVLLEAVARVVRPAVPSLDPNLTLLSADLDFGEQAVGGFVDLGVAVHNLGHDALQSALHVFDAQLTGDDAGRFFTVGFAPTLVEEVPFVVGVGFDDSAVTPGATYTATLTLSTRDDPAVVGGKSRAELVVGLTATVAEDAVAAPEAIPMATRLLPNRPNPFNPRTLLRFELAEAGPVRLEILDLRGRRVRTVLDGSLGSGLHERLWQGRDDRGGSVSSGGYLLRMITADGIHTQTLTLIR